MEMYIWKISLQGEYKTSWKEGKKSKSEYWDDNEEYVVAAESGLAAIEKVKRIFMSQEPEDTEHYEPYDVILPATYVPNRVLDITYLELKEALDG